ncbi:MAG: cupin domain-containing protein [Solirubrobacteraceae bacterium]
MRRLLVITALLGALSITAAALAAGGSSPISEEVLGAGSVAHPYSIHVRKPADVVVAKATVPPGASFGWHSHRAFVIAVIASGTLTLYDSADRSCSPHRYSAGQGFVERRNHVHLARNEGDKPVVVFVTYIGLKHGVNPDVPAKSPGNCPF